MGGAHFFTLKHLNRQTGLKSIAIDGTQFGCSQELGQRRRRSRIIAWIILQPNRVPRLKNRWSSQLTASNIVFVLVHKFPFMPCFDIFNLLYSHLTPRPNHKCPSTLLKVFSTLREWWSARRNCLLRPPGFRKAVFYQCADLGNVSNTPSTKRRAAAKWKLQYEWQIKQCQLDSTGDIQPTCSAYKKKLNHWDHRILNVGRGWALERHW